MDTGRSVRYHKSLRVEPLWLVGCLVSIFTVSSWDPPAGVQLLVLGAAWMLWRADRDNGQNN